MIFHKYTIEFIVPSTQVETNMSAFYGQLQELFQSKDMSLSGIRSGTNTDYSSQMSVMVMMKPPAPAEPGKTVDEQVNNLQIKEKVK